MVFRSLLARVPRVALASTLTVGASAASAEPSDKYGYVLAAAVLGYTAYKNTTSLASVESRLGALEIKAARNEASAFVFIKPHAVTD